MKRIYKTLFGAFLISSVIFLTGCITTKAFTLKPYEHQTNEVWAGTFQLVWNEFMNNITKGPVIFEGKNPPLVDELNKQSFTDKMISANAVYKIAGLKSPELKAEIEKGIWDKFKEKSSLLNNIDWTKSNQYVIYAMLKKDFSYLYPFKELTAQPFNNSKQKYKYFGIVDDVMGRDKNLNVLISSKNEYALSLNTKEGDEVILFKTKRSGTFDELYQYVVKKSKKRAFSKNDSFKAPYISLSKEIHYNQLCNKPIKNASGVRIGTAIQNIDFNLDNTGGNVKSEAIIASTNSLRIDKGKHYFFDDKFVLFIKEKNSSKPYFALWVDNGDILVKEDK